mmetsp:Transcript_1066/g.1122  ORF Transcript_1066/g.1122 Transcript_1066/m.1122 type:complete len:83 (+) Transcript_1066:120-368(+)
MNFLTASSPKMEKFVIGIPRINQIPFGKGNSFHLTVFATESILMTNACDQLNFEPHTMIQNLKKSIASSGETSTQISAELSR